MEKFGPDGSFAASFGSAGTDPGLFQSLQAVAVDATGNIFTVDQARVQKFDSAGAFQWAATGFGSIMGMAVSPSGEVFVDDTIQHRIRRVSPSGVDDGALPPPPDGRSFAPQDVAVDAAGDLLVWNSFANEVEKFDQAGTLKSSWTPSGNMPPPPNAVANLRAHAADTPPPPPPGGASNATPLVGPVAGAPNGGAYTAAGNPGSILRLDPTSPDVITFETVNDNPLLSQHRHVLRARASVPFGSVAEYRFDTDGDGSFETLAPIDALGGMAAVTYPQPGHYRVKVRATADGGSSTESGPVVGLPYLDVRPNPPAGTPGVSINDGAQYTNTPNVQLAIVWPPLSLQVFVANDGGFRGSAGQALAPTIAWKLDSSGAERLPKTVYIRFEGVPNDMLPSGAQVGGPSSTFTDDIILDETAPLLKSASLVGSAGAARVSRSAKVRVRLRASDANSGVATAQFRRGRKLSSPVKFRRVLVVARPPSAARVRDRAGNWSRWHKVLRPKP